MPDPTGPAGAREAGIDLTETYLTPLEAAKLIGLSTRTLEPWRRLGGGPPFVRVSKKVVRYPASALHSWMAARTFTSTADEAVRGVPRG